MNQDRRNFIKTAVSASAALGVLGSSDTFAAARSFEFPTEAQEYYELRSYRLKPDAPRALIDLYLEKAFIPALNARGIKNVGVFTEPDAKDGPALWVLISHANVQSVVAVTSTLNLDSSVQSAGADYFRNVGPSNPAFDRIDSWLLLAFAGLPRMTPPAIATERKARIYELRTYESFSELTALKKVDMFNAGEIGVMQDVNLGPVFFGQALIGRDLPHLTYMLSSPDRETLKRSWSAFGKHPKWIAMKEDPQYADTVSKITSRMLEPTAYSQL
jgi:hypothetical protein